MRNNKRESSKNKGVIKKHIGRRPKRTATCRSSIGREIGNSPEQKFPKDLVRTTKERRRIRTRSWNNWRWRSRTPELPKIRWEQPTMTSNTSWEILSTSRSWMAALEEEPITIMSWTWRSERREAALLTPRSRSWQGKRSESKSRGLTNRARTWRSSRGRSSCWTGIRRWWAPSSRRPMTRLSDLWTYYSTVLIQVFLCQLEVTS